MKDKISIDLLNQYKETFIRYIDVDTKTIHAYKCGIEKLIDYLNTNNLEATRNNIINFRNYLRVEFSNNTVNSYMTSLKVFFNYLNDNNICKNLTKDIKGAEYTYVPVKQVLSQEKVKEIYQQLTDLEEKALWSLLFGTGLRGCEVSSANIEDIKLYNGERVLFVLGKKRDSKSEYVKISNTVYQDIMNYVGNRTVGSIFISTSNNSLGNGISTTSIRKKIKNIFKRFGYDDNTYSLHSTRRTSATIMYLNGVDDYSIQQVLRHKSIVTTTRYINAITRNENKAEYVVSDVVFGGC